MCLGVSWNEAGAVLSDGAWCTLVLPADRIGLRALRLPLSDFLAGHGQGPSAGQLQLDAGRSSRGTGQRLGGALARTLADLQHVQGLRLGLGLGVGGEAADLQEESSVVQETRLVLLGLGPQTGDGVVSEKERDMSSCWRPAESYVSLPESVRIVFHQSGSQVVGVQAGRCTCNMRLLLLLLGRRCGCCHGRVHDQMEVLAGGGGSCAGGIGRIQERMVAGRGGHSPGPDPDPDRATAQVVGHLDRHLPRLAHGGLLVLQLLLGRGGAELDVGTARAVGGGPARRGGVGPGVTAAAVGRGRGGRRRRGGGGAAAGRRADHVQGLRGGAEGARVGAQLLRVGGLGAGGVLVVAHPRVVLEGGLGLDGLPVHACGVIGNISLVSTPKMIVGIPERRAGLLSCPWKSIAN